MLTPRRHGAPRRPDYRDMTLTFAIALGEGLKSQRRWLTDFHDIAAVGAPIVPHVLSRSGPPRTAMVPTCRPSPDVNLRHTRPGVARDQGAARASCPTGFSAA